MRKGRPSVEVEPKVAVVLEEPIRVKVRRNRMLELDTIVLGRRRKSGNWLGGFWVEEPNAPVGPQVIPTKRVKWKLVSFSRAAKCVFNLKYGTFAFRTSSIAGVFLRGKTLVRNSSRRVDAEGWRVLVANVNMYRGRRLKYSFITWPRCTLTSEELISYVPLLQGPRVEFEVVELDGEEDLIELVRS